MQIVKARAHLLENYPVTPPPFRDLPSHGESLIVEVETDEGLVGWAYGNVPHSTFANFINTQIAPALIGEDPIRTERIWRKFMDARPEGKFGARRLGVVLMKSLSSVDMALWDIKAKAMGLPLHHVLGGNADKVPVYVTHGAAYGKALPYSPEELAAEASHLVSLGIKHLKIPAGRQLRDNEYAPDPDDDLVRMTAVREAVGPEIDLSMDGNCRMTRAGALRLCKLVEELRISFFEEPVVNNDPADLAAIRRQTSIPIAAAENDQYFLRNFTEADAIDIFMPNVSSDGGYTRALKLAAAAASYNLPIGHGNGGGIHNLALHAGVANGTKVEYHFHHWMRWNVILENVPAPDAEGFIHLPMTPGSGIQPKDGVLEEFAATSLD